MAHLQTLDRKPDDEGDVFIEWKREIDVLNSSALDTDPANINCITSMLQNPESFRTHDAVDFLDMHFDFFTRDKDSYEKPEVPSATIMKRLPYFLNRWRREWFNASESKCWFTEMFGSSLTQRQISNIWTHFRKMRELLEKKLEIEPLMDEYARSYLDQSVLRSISPTPTACFYFSDSATPSPPNSPPSQSPPFEWGYENSGLVSQMLRSISPTRTASMTHSGTESSATPSPPNSPSSNSPLSSWEYEHSELVPQMSPSWGDTGGDSFLRKGDNDPETRRRS
jgi:hypothetical protein